MKIIGKTAEGYIVTLTESEVKIIAFNDDGSLSRDQESIISKNPEINIQEPFRNFRRFIYECEEVGERQEITKKLQSILNHLRPVQNFLVEQKKLKS